MRMDGFMALIAFGTEVLIQNYFLDRMNTDVVVIPQDVQASKLIVSS